MQRFKTYFLADKGETWVYLVGTLTSPDVVETVATNKETKNYDIVRFNLEYEQPMRVFAYETVSYNVFLVGRLIADKTVAVCAMFDHPDITGKGYVSLSSAVCVAGRMVSLPRPFIFLPTTFCDKLVGDDVVNLRSPYFKLDDLGKHKKNLFFSYSINGEDCDAMDKSISVNVVLADAYGYDRHSPALFVGEGSVSIKTDPSDRTKKTITFVGEQICKNR